MRRAAFNVGWIALLGVLCLAGEVLATPLLPAAGRSARWTADDGASLVAARRRRKSQPRKPAGKKPTKAPETAAEPAPAPVDPGGEAVPMGPGGRTRVDFDAMQIKGQTTKAGEVQVLERKDSELKSMVKRRTSFRDEIILTVFPDKGNL